MTLKKELILEIYRIYSEGVKNLRMMFKKKRYNAPRTRFVEGGAMTIPGKSPWSFSLNHSYDQYVAIEI